MMMTIMLNQVLDVYFCRGVSTSAAQRVAAVWTGRRRTASTLAVSRSDAPALGVGATVVGRSFDVDEFRVADRLSSHPLLAPSKQRRRRARSGGRGDHGSRRYLHRVLVLVPEGVADASELRKRLPAGPHGAGAGHAVAAAFRHHQLRYRLQHHSDRVDRAGLKLKIFMRHKMSMSMSISMWLCRFV